MSRVLAALATAAAATGWAAAVRWREKSTWVSQNDLDAGMAQVMSDAVTAEPTDDDGGLGYASMFVGRAAEPPDPARPWFAAIAVTHYEDGVDGLRIIDSRTDWFPSKNDAYDWFATVGANHPRGVPEF